MTAEQPITSQIRLFLLEQLQNNADVTETSVAANPLFSEKEKLTIFVIWSLFADEQTRQRLLPSLLAELAMNSAEDTLQRLQQKIAEELQSRSE